MDPSSSKCENISEITRDGLAEGELLGMRKELDIDLSATATSALSSSSSTNCEEIDESIGDGPAEEESETDSEGLFSDGEAADDELGTDLIRAAIDGNVHIFDEPNLSDEDFFKKTREENNILHIAVRYERTKFLKVFLKKYFPINKKPLTERNSHRDTPLHAAAEVGNEDIVKLLCHYLKKKSAEESGHEGVEEKPWRAQNSEGNTALHLALISNHFFVAEFLVKRDGGLARIVNNSQEAPLHLAITHLHLYKCKDMTSFLLEKARCVASWRDAKGFTPLLRAASLDPRDILEVTKMIIDVYPDSTLVCDASGKSFLHLVIHNKIFDVHQKNGDEWFEFFYKNIEDLICLNEISILKNHQDQEGNTPLHIALICGNIHMARSLVSKCSADPDITNKDGISARSMIEQRNLLHQLHETRAMTEEESSSAKKGDINFLLEIQRTNGLEFYGSQDDDDGSNFLHLLMSKTTEHHYSVLSSDVYHKIFGFLLSTLFHYPQHVCQTDQKGNTPLHILAQNKDFCRILADQTLPESRSLLSMLLSICANAITKMKSSRTTTIEADNHDWLPWVMQNGDGNTPLHEAIMANNRVMVLELLNYSEESTRLVNKNKETPLHLLAATSIGMEEFMVEEIMEIVKANSKAVGLQDKDGLIPILRAIIVKNLNVVVTLLLYTVQEFKDIINGQTLWQIFLKNQSNHLVDQLLQLEAFRKVLEQKDKDGNTLLHIAIKEKCFGFVQNLLETWGSEHDKSSEDNRWLKIPNNVGVTPEDLLADLPTLSHELEEKLLTDRRMMGIRSSWRIPRTQLQNYMKSINVIAALQTTITFTAAFAVPGGLIQDKGFPILISSIAFQVFMISDVIAMCLSMMVLICPFWMVSGTKRKSVEIQDFTLSLLQASFVATLMTFMSGVFATIYPVKRWIAITTLVLCSLLTLLLRKFIVTLLLLPFYHATVNFVKKILDPAAEFCSKTIRQLKRIWIYNCNTSRNQRNIV